METPTIHSESGRVMGPHCPDRSSMQPTFSKMRNQYEVMMNVPAVAQVVVRTGARWKYARITNDGLNVMPDRLLTNLALLELSLLR